MKLSSLKRFFYNPVVLIVLSAILAPIVTDIYNKVPFATSFIDIYHWIVKWFLFILTYNLKVWYILLAGLIVIGCIWLKRYIDGRKYEPTDENGMTDADWDRAHQQMEKEEYKRYQKKQDLLGYKNDKFLKYTWEWEWIKNPKLGIYESKNITACCPNIECELNPMIYEGNSGLTSNTYRCSNCHKRSTVVGEKFGEITHEIESYIQEKVETF